MGMKKDNVIDDELYKSLLTTNPNKVHKQGNPGRPITSSNGTVSEKLSAFVDFHLTEFMNGDFIPSYIKDTTDFLNSIRELLRLPDNTLLVTMNVKAPLYTNISHSDGIAAVAHIMHKHHKNPILTN